MSVCVHQTHESPLSSTRNVSRSGFMLSVGELVRFVGRLATLGLQLEGCHSLLLSFILDFYDTVMTLTLMNEWRSVSVCRRG